MKRQQILSSVLVLGLLLALAVGLSLAQEPEPPEEEINALSVIEADSVSGRIPIQGRLTDNNDDPVADRHSHLHVHPLPVPDSGSGRAVQHLHGLWGCATRSGSMAEY
jgi:hypothetical protein